MPNVRVSLSSVGFKKTPIPNSILVLQSLYKEGFTISLLNGKRYSKKMDILEWFADRNIRIHFLDVQKPEIEVNNTFVKVLDEKKSFDLVSGWEQLDKQLLEKGIYERKDNDYHPSYTENTYFMVMNYGEKDQFIDSNPKSFKRCQRACKSLNTLKDVRTIHIVDCNTLAMVECFDFTTGKTETLEPGIFFSVLV